MLDAKSVITTATKGHVEEIAKRREITVSRMYEILGKDNPYPKSKVLIRDIAEFNQEGARLIKADMDALWTDILGLSCPKPTVKDLNQEAFEAINSFLAEKSDAEKKQQLRELIMVAELMIGDIDDDRSNELPITARTRQHRVSSGRRSRNNGR
jgi:hypothetical protein